MNPAVSLTILLPDEAATTRLAGRLAPLLGPGDTLLLQGGLGTGKTHFARGLIQARLAANGLAEEVPSPTFTLVQTYWDGTTEIWHCDLYRLSGGGDTHELGLDEAFSSAICLIEWPDRLEHVPEDALYVALEMGGTPGERRATLSSPDARWADVLGRLDD